MTTEIQSFADKLHQLGYKNLTPIQKIAIPKILSGSNTLIIAPTGFGKTEAAIIPVFYLIFAKRPKEISSLYITPLRALNRDLQSRLEKIGNELGIKIKTRHGDTSTKERKNIIQDPPDLLITTPESLQYLILNKNYRELFRNLNWIIIDELQEMLYEKRGYELSVALQRLKAIANNLQIIGLSATIGDLNLATKYLDIQNNVEIAKIDAIKEFDISLEVPDISSDQSIIDLSVKHGLNPTTIARLKTISEIIEKNKPTLVFTNTRETAEFLANQLHSLFSQNISTYHGSLSREIRVDIEKNFKNKKLDAIISTSSLELGIDIGFISLIVQYMSPKQTTRLLQRVGRSGHSINKKSKGIIIPSDYPFDILECENLIKLAKQAYLEKPNYEHSPLDVLAHQLVGMILEGYSKKDEIANILHKSVYFSDITESEIDDVIELLESEKIIKNKDGQLKPSMRAWKYYYNTSMIPDSIKNFEVIEISSNSKIGTLDQDFALTLDEDTIFVLAGKLWKVVSISENNIYVEKATLKNGILPSWFGESIPVEKEVSLEVYKELQDILNEKTKSEYKEIQNIVEEYKNKKFPTLKENEILVEVIQQDLIVINSPFGSKGNNTLGSLLSFTISKEKNISINYRNDPYHIVLSSVIPISTEDIQNAIDYILKLDKEKAKEIIEISIQQTPQFKWKLLTEAERFGAIDKEKDIKNISSTLLKAYTNTIIGKEAIKELLVKNHDLEILHLLEKFSWKILETPIPSPLSKDFLDKLLILSQNTESEPIMLEIYKKRLQAKEIQIICLVCGWNQQTSVKNTPDKCPKCGSAFLTATYPEDKQTKEIIRKKIKGEKLKRNETYKLEEAQKIASLFSRYGKNTFIALAVNGVGPNNLGKVLGKLPEGEEKFYLTLMEEEKRFLRYKKYYTK
ncbi:DEAD/DEAH box helicase [Acidianus manzaensis]|uniref:Helicase n=1 Tax=Acidianus manzaensis TaxID=282676 RepID=A0A1W6K012_9CREN|nr:DEAD/DEAH box helicase [Acidianus manzaensis]ARM75827.1 helicase [Acidianus manzaensis]